MALHPYKVIPDDWDQFYSEQVQDELPDYLDSFYHQPLLDSQQSMQATDFVALDIETTGLNAQKDDIVSIGLVPFDHQRIYLAKAKHWVVSSQHLTSESVVVHRITHSEVAGAPSLASVIPELVASLQGKQVVVHYRYIEREFFRTAMAELLQKNFLFPLIDTLELEAQYLRRNRSLGARFFNKQLPSLRLLYARERYNLPAYENHNALVDALATAELLQAQIAKHKLAQTPVRKLWY
ncbi:MAG: DNA polymerase-3 subunit epsilon [Oleispira sp.]|jgi:DNA polymerase-3 subunit epsilon